MEARIDDWPATGQFGSNYCFDARVAVAEAVFREGAIDEASGAAIDAPPQTHQLVPNDPTEAHAKRRVKVVGHDGRNDEVQRDLDAIRRNDSEGFQRVRIDLTRRLRVSLDDA